MALVNKEQLEEQVTKLQNELNQLRESVSAVSGIGPWQPTGGDYFIGAYGELLLSSSTKEYKEFGTERATKAQAEKARDAMRVFNRLLAYRDEFMPNPYNYSGDTYTIYCNHYTKEWYSRCTDGIEGPTDVGMSYNVVKDLVRKLNSGEVVL